MCAARLLVPAFPRTPQQRRVDQSFKESYKHFKSVWVKILWGGRATPLKLAREYLEKSE